ncbi:alcohol dehydrogenase catalytic domain-containing protein, partial [Phenylobacterium sp.]|uniref:alcohol dehydrogenase catalytic domain-containing protein n=1 Tax=Phenylobacterium sp. TaxID=1871053 RepID=UPI002E36AC7B
MQAYVLTQEGPKLTQIDPPKPRPAEVLVRVRAAALNRVDLAMTRGHMHGGAGGVGAALGLEWAGEVVEAGPEVQGLVVVQRVMGSGAGAFAEYTTADYGGVWPIPDAHMSFETAATLPVALRTMHDAVVTNGALEPGQTVMINGASSGV